MVCAACGHENGSAARFCESCGAALSAGSGERRKVVTVLFCDVVGSTTLGESTDPEALRALLARYFERMSGIVEAHGGSVEKFIGDAVMAVFGVPAVHEDDALRACRAAVEMREALPALGIDGRIGVSTGEVVTGSVERLATGDALNVAARLQQAASPGDVLIAEATRALAADAVDVEPVEPLVLKGKAEPVPAFRLLAARAAPERRHDSSFAGRERELALLTEAWGRALARQRCELVTVAGDPGIGKSRLAAEALGSIGARARVVRGRCLPYGAGITYWPAVEVVQQLDALPSDPAAAAAIHALLGESEEGTSAEEIAWACRKLFEEQAPLVVVFDDIQWGEETFLDLIEHVALLSSGAPLLLLCLARPELLDSRPAWPVTVRLEPLDKAEAASLIGTEVPEELRVRIAAAAGGNPLFILEMLAMAHEAGSDVAVPQSLKALLAARFDQFDPAERRVLERGAIEGEVFHRGAVQALTPEEAHVTPRLAALVRRQLIRPDRPQFEGEDGFRFRHLLIRDAAYDALPKATRADLHQRYAAWLEQHAGGLAELDELLGYHLEQTCLYRAELGTPDGGEPAVAARRHLTAAGRRAKLRSDYSAAVSLLERAAALVPAAEIDLAIEIELSDALFSVGKGDDALRRADALAERAAAAGDRVGELCGRIRAASLATNLEAEDASEKLAALVDEALPLFRAAGDDLALYTAYYARAQAAFASAQLDEALEAYERASAHAREAGQSDELLGWRGLCRLYGTTPASNLLAWLDENEPPQRRDHWLRATRAGGLAMLGRFDEARATLAQTRAELAELGGGLQLAVLTGIESAIVELLAGDPTAASEFSAEGCRLLEELGDVGFLSSAATTLAQALYELDRLDEADASARRGAELGASDDAFTQMSWRQTQAKVLARRGEHAEAEHLAREAVATGEATQFLDGQGDAYADLAEVLLLGGRRAEAAEALDKALACYERKGNLVSAGRARDRRADLEGPASRRS